MKLQDAIEQYVDMISLGSQALQRFAQGEVEGGQLALLSNQLEKIVDLAEQLRGISSALM